jgi:hypothetical protein
MKKTFIAICLAISFISVSCAPMAINDAKTELPYNNLPVLTSKDGFRYRIIVLEKRTFIATQGHYGEWYLAGPIDCCRNIDTIETR